MSWQKRANQNQNKIEWSAVEQGKGLRRKKRQEDKKGVSAREKKKYAHSFCVIGQPRNTSQLS